MKRVIRLDFRGPQPDAVQLSKDEPRTVDRASVRLADDGDVLNAIKRVTREHEELIKALAK